VTATTVRYQLNRPTIIDEMIDGEVVVVDLYRGFYYSIRGAGVDIWHLLAEPVTSGEVADQIAARFALDRSVAAATVDAFIAELDINVLVREAEGEPAAQQVRPAPTAPPPSSFEPPLLEKFTDLEDLLLLDPIDDVTGRGWPNADRAVDARGWPEPDPSP
jgi:hypothetical protein